MDANYYMHFGNHTAKAFARDYNAVLADPAEKEHLFTGSYDFAEKLAALKELGVKAINAL